MSNGGVRLQRRAAGGGRGPVDELGGTGLYLAHDVRPRLIRPQAHQQVHVAGHVMDRDELVPLCDHDARYVLLQLGVAFGEDEGLSALHGKDYLNVDLRVRVGNTPGCRPYGAWQ